METKCRMNSTSSIKLVDINGMEHLLSDHNVTIILIVGWTSFLLSCVFNILYYKVHPSGVDFNLSRFQNKLHFYICGYRVDFDIAENEEFDDNRPELVRLVSSNV